jgi:hypothetical protein
MTPKKHSSKARNSGLLRGGPEIILQTDFGIALLFFRSFVVPGGFVGCGKHTNRRLRAAQHTPSSLYALVENHFEEFERICNDRYQQQNDRCS